MLLLATSELRRRNGALLGDARSFEDFCKKVVGADALGIAVVVAEVLGKMDVLPHRHAA